MIQTKQTLYHHLYLWNRERTGTQNPHTSVLATSPWLGEQGLTLPWRQPEASALRPLLPTQISVGPFRNLHTMWPEGFFLRSPLPYSVGWIGTWVQANIPLCFLVNQMRLGRGRGYREGLRIFIGNFHSPSAIEGSKNQRAMVNSFLVEQPEDWVVPNLSPNPQFAHVLWT